MDEIASHQRELVVASWATLWGNITYGRCLHLGLTPEAPAYARDSHPRLPLMRLSTTWGAL